MNIKETMTPSDLVAISNNKIGYLPDSRLNIKGYDDKLQPLKQMSSRGKQSKGLNPWFIVSVALGIYIFIKK